MGVVNRHCARQLHNMTATQAFFLFCTLLQTILTEGQVPLQPEPQFLAPLENHTVTQGRDVYFTCVVNHLSHYKVAWIKSDTKTILAIHTNMVAQNPRLLVTHNGHDTWMLHVYNVQKNDSGTYMCQINTDPMRSQMGMLEVVIPPDILPDPDADSSGVAIEGGTVRLRCKATGVPEPTVSWRREDGNYITLRSDNGRERKQVRTYDGEVFTLSNVHRTDMGAYLCIAKNGVPPLVSKRFEVTVQFVPLIKVTNQLLGSPIGSDVLLQCYVEASPKAMNHWSRDNGEKIIPSDKYVIVENVINEYSLQMDLTIKNLTQRDFGTYNCTSTNAIGTADGTVRLQQLHITVKSTSTVKPFFIHKNKSLKKYKHSRKKETNDNKREEQTKNTTLVLQEVTTPARPTTLLSTTYRPPSWILLQRNCGQTYLPKISFLFTFIYLPIHKIHKDIQQILMS